jgi:uncharacterized OB-fold protein
MTMDAQESSVRSGLPTFKEQHETLRDGKMQGFLCRECSFQTVTPVVRCPECGSRSFETKEFATTGTVATFTVQRVAMEEFLNDTPYAWVVVQLDEGGPRATGWVPFISKSGELKIGDKVKLTTSYKPGCMFEKA